MRASVLFMAHLDRLREAAPWRFWRDAQIQSKISKMKQRQKQILQPPGKGSVRNLESGREADASASVYGDWAVHRGEMNDRRGAAEFDAAMILVPGFAGVVTNAGVAAHG